MTHIHSLWPLASSLKFNLDVVADFKHAHKGLCGLLNRAAFQNVREVRFDHLFRIFWRFCPDFGALVAMDVFDDRGLSFFRGCLLAPNRTAADP